MSEIFINKLAIIVPTRNRMECLSELLESIIPQKDIISQIIVVDGSDEPMGETFFANYPFKVDYAYVNPPSLTRQKNEGIKLLNEDITLAGYLDDDIVLGKNAIEKLLDFWENCGKDVGGTSFNIINNPKIHHLRKYISILFLIDSKKRGKVLKSGFCTSYEPLNENLSVEWLCGGATIWRREILENHKYDEFLKGWAYYEDAVFSYEISHNYKLFVVKDAKVEHNPPPYNVEKNVNLGKISTVNRYHFVRKYEELSVFFFMWSTIGEILIGFLQSIIYKNRGGFLLAYGHITGLINILLNNITQSDDNFRK